VASMLLQGLSADNSVELSEMHRCACRYASHSQLIHIFGERDGEMNFVKWTGGLSKSL
jgi:hypothetical protein